MAPQASRPVYRAGLRLESSIRKCHTRAPSYGFLQVSMEHSATLIGLAQISLVLTGFVAVFVAFHANGRKPTKPDVHHAVSMLIGSVLALLIALVPIVLSAYGLDREFATFVCCSLDSCGTQSFGL